MSSSRIANRATPILAQIGNTPLLELHFEAEDVTIFAKAEFLNPSGSIKDRLAQTILVDAHDRGVLQPDSVILECTSDNTGIALAMVGAAMGYPVKILMSHQASVERRHLIRQQDRTFRTHGGLPYRYPPDVRNGGRGSALFSTPSI